MSTTTPSKLPLQPTSMNNLPTNSPSTATTQPFHSGIPAPTSSKLPRFLSSPLKPVVDALSASVSSLTSSTTRKPKVELGDVDVDVKPNANPGKENGEAEEDVTVAGAAGVGARKRKGPPLDDQEDDVKPRLDRRPAPLGTRRPMMSSSTTVRPGTSASNSRPGSSTGFVPTSRAASTATAGRRPLSASTSTTTTTSRPLPSSSASSSALPGRRPLNASTTTSGAPGLNRTRTASNSNLRAGSSTVTTAGARRVPVGAAAGSRAGAGGRTAGGTGAGVGVGAVSGLGGSVTGGRGVGQMQMQYDTGRIDQVENMVAKMHEMMQLEQQKVSKLHTSQTELQTLLQSTQNTEREARRNLSTAGEEIAALREKHRNELDDVERQLAKRERERRDLEDDLRACRADLEEARGQVRDVKAALNAQATAQITMTAEVATLRDQNRALQQEVEQKTGSMLEMKIKADQADERVREIQEDLRAAETIRRKLHNQVQELKGNIRVFARVRPAIGSELEVEDALAEIEYAQKGQLTSSGQQQLTIAKVRDSAVGATRKETVPFSFDKVFQPNDGQHEVFEEISMLAQSVLDGYNVCIFAYGQTGSGKSWTMEGGKTADTAGMIPRAIHMIFTETEALKERGWRYQMYGQFVEIYNEKINNLFGTANDQTEHKIEHDEKKGTTTVTGINPIRLETPDQVHSLLARASNLRSVAATNMNERSSRSHSVFSLRVKGDNPLTGENCEGVLNLVDLAGSERLDKAGTGEHKDRMKETININKSLSSLQNVIQKLSEKSTNDKAHVGYRDSTLTNLLMYSLSGHSKTLMFCNLSPMAAHTNETLNSLRFATKVNSTTIGTAKRQARSS